MFKMVGIPRKHIGFLCEGKGKGNGQEAAPSNSSELLLMIQATQEIEEENEQLGRLVMVWLQRMMSCDARWVLDAVQVYKGS